MTGVELDAGFVLVVVLEAVFLGVPHVGVEVLKLDLNLLGGDGYVIGEGLHYLGVMN